MTIESSDGRPSWLDRRERDLKHRLWTSRREAAVALSDMETALSGMRTIMSGMVADRPSAALSGGIGVDMADECGERAWDLSRLCRKAALLLGNAETDEELLDLFVASRERLAEESRDVDGTCRYRRYGDGDRCRAPTVEDTCWCADHIDLWCEVHYEHAITELSGDPLDADRHCALCVEERKEGDRQ